MSNLGKTYKSYKRLSQEEKEMIEKLYNEKMELTNDTNIYLKK